MAIIERKYGYKRLEDIFNRLNNIENYISTYISNGNGVSWIHQVSVTDDHFILDITIFTEN